MGSSKAWLDFCGEPMLARVARIVSTVATKTVVASQRDQSLPPLPEDCQIVHDKIPDAGPLAGMEAGLVALGENCEAAFVVSCDHPLIEESFLRALSNNLGNRSGLIPSYQGRTYPLLAIYRAYVLTQLRELFDKGERRVRTFASACHAAEIDVGTLVGHNLRSLTNANDPETLENALQLAKQDLQ